MPLSTWLTEFNGLGQIRKARSLPHLQHLQELPEEPDPLRLQGDLLKG